MYDAESDQDEIFRKKLEDKLKEIQQRTHDYRSSSWADLKKYFQPIEWDWQGWLPRGFLIVLASEPGMGKSLLCLRLAGCFLAGLDWPDGRPFEGERGKVIWCEGEASQALNLGRANRWQLNLNDIISPLPHPLDGFQLDNVKHMVALLHFCRKPEVKLVVLDSLSGLVVGGPTAYDRSNSEVQGIPRVLHQLGEIARLTKKPILLTHHLRKRTSLDRDGFVDLQRLRGTSIIGQKARVVWTLDAPDVYEPENKRLGVVKNNLMPPPEPVGMRIGEKGLVFGEAPEPTGVLGERVSEVDRAETLLVGLLAEGERSYLEIEAAFVAAGLHEKSVRRAKERLGVVSVRRRGEKGWWWMRGA